MINKIRLNVAEKSLNKKNQSSGKIVVKNETLVDLDKNSVVEVSGKLVLGASDWKNDNRVSGLKLGKNATLKVEKKQQIYTGSYISVGENAILELGGEGFINHGCNIDCFNHISIGEGTIIAKEVIIRDSDNHELVYNNYVKSKPIHIGKHCWIGMRATILKGVTVGDGAVIAAGAVVTKNVASNSLVAGIPAKIVKKNIIWE